MKIGLDIRKYDDYGIGTYIQNLISVLEYQGNLERVYFAHSALIDRLQGSLKSTMITENSMKYSFKELISLSRHANSQKIDLYHSPHYTLPIGLNMPSIVTIHDIIHLRLKKYFSIIQRSYAYFMIQHACSASKAIIVDSEYGKQELVSSFDIQESKIKVIPLGVNAKFFEDIQFNEIEVFKSAMKISKKYILYTGSVKPHKNIPTLLRAFKLLRSNHNIQLVFTGERLSSNNEYYEYVKNNNLTEDVLDLGRISQSDLYKVYKASEMVVLPSFYEGFGFSMLEGMASGVPAIGANSTSIPEVVGDAGLLFDPHDEKDLASQIEKILTNAQFRHEYIEKGRKRARQFSWNICAQKTLKVYQEILT